MVSVGRELLNVPFGEMIVKMALGIAEGQAKLDENAIETAKFLATTTITLPPITKSQIKMDDKGMMSPPGVDFPLIALGFYPPFYHFVESIIEVKMAITMATTRETRVGASMRGGWGPFAASVNASYSSKYEYKVEGSSLLRTKLVPVPPPTGLQKYIEALIRAQSEKLEKETKKGEDAAAAAAVEE